MSRLSLILAVLLVNLGLAGCKSDRGDTGGMGGDAGDGDGELLGTACDDKSACDDGVFCNGEEVCISGFCRRGERVDCNDGIKCTLDRCVESSKSCTSVLPDKDNDGSFDARCEDANGNSGDDCDDDDPEAFPGNTEVCDAEHRDEDCDPTTLGFRDADNDGYIDAQCCNRQDDGDLLCGEDCDDHKANVNPEAPEVCDFLDNDCSGDIDEGVAVKMFPDTDHDGHGDDSEKFADGVETCPGAVGFALVANDCDDKDPEVFLGQFEICDNKDNNCDGNIDEIEEHAPWFADLDQDGYGDPESSPVFSCYRVAGRVLSHNDCNDKSNKINPNATELCDGLDNDCNGLADYRLPGINNFEDDDRDGIPDADCDGGTDCNDTDPRTGDGFEEVCDRVDNDCDGEIDEQTVQNIWYIDDDGDGWGVILGSALASCDPLPGRATQFGDCDDTQNGVHPGSTEFCDGIDQDCDGEIDEGASVHCKLENAISTCSQGACQVFSCIPGFIDADGNQDNGCEVAVDLSSLPPGLPCAVNADCNDGNICNGVEVCHQLACRAGTPLNCELANQIIQGNVFINTGLDIKALKGVEIITGNVVIQNTTLSSLVGLESLKTIGGSLIIADNINLKKLSGSALSNLEVVGGSISVQNNLALTSVDLPSLISANALEIRANPALREIKNAYPNLAAVADRIVIVYNEELELISGFEALTRIGGERVCQGRCGACTGGGLEIYGNNYVKITGFSNLQQTGGVCLSELSGDLITLPALSAISMGLLVGHTSSLKIDFPKLKTIQNDSQISSYSNGTTPLVEINFPELRTIGGDYSLDHEGPDLKLIKMPKLTSASSVYINLSQLSDLQTLDLSKLEQVDGSLSLYFGEVSSFETLSFPKLTRASSVYVSATNLPPEFLSDPNWIPGGPQFIRFDALTTTSVVDLVVASAIEGISFAALKSASAVNISPTMGPAGPSALPSLGFIDFNQLETISSQIYVTTPIPNTSVAASGFRADKLSVVGVTNDVDTNDGIVTLCTGANPDPVYDNAACGVISALISNGFVGPYDSCGQCATVVGM